MQCDNLLITWSSIQTIEIYVEAIYDEFFYMFFIHCQVSLLHSLVMHPQFQDAAMLDVLSNLKKTKGSKLVIESLTQTLEGLHG